MNKLKKQNGITLIALVITIIVMLILVAVTITVAVNGGLFNYAGKAVGDTQNAIEREQELASLQNGLTSDDLIAKYTGGWYPKGDGTFTNGKSTVALGDYINYKPYNAEYAAEHRNDLKYESKAENNGYTDEENQTFTVTEASNNIKWQVLGVENGNLLITMEGQVYPDGSNGYYLRGAEGYNNGIAELNEISKIYGHGENAVAVGARSITADDVNKITGYNPLKDANYAGKAHGYVETETATEKKIWEYGNKVTYTIGNDGKISYTSTNGKSGNSNYTNLMKPGETTNTSPLTVESTYYYYDSSIIEGDATKRALVFEDDDYWLASSYVYASEGYVSWGLRDVYDGGLGNYDLWDSYGGTNDDHCGVRPVVSLKSDIKLKAGTAANTWDFDTTAE